MKLSTVFTVACMAAVSTTTTDAAPTPASYNLARRRASETPESINASASLASAGASLASENSQNAPAAPIAASSKIVVDAGSSVVPTTNKESTQKSVSPEEQQGMREGTSKSRVATTSETSNASPQESSTTTTSSSSSNRAATLMKEIIAAVRTRETALSASQDPTDVRLWLNTLVQMNPELTVRMVQNVAAMEVKLLKAQGKETSVEFRAFQAVAQSSSSSSTQSSAVEKETTATTPRKESSTMPEGAKMGGKSASTGAAAAGLEMGKPLSAGVTEKMPEMPKDGDAVMPAGMASMVGMQGSGAFSFSALAGLSSVLSMFLIL
ncbi:hypothetical protein HDU80_007743 [Chytriomyces hyalinus]|nr:hypothetical protein HDU80_007743 [Chytriomyces hyalinus]